MNWLLLHATNICWNFVWSQFIGTHGHTDIISLKVFRIQRTYVRNKLRLSESFITNNKHTRAHAHSRSYNTAEATYGLCVFNIRFFDFPSLFRCPLLRSHRGNNAIHSFQLRTIRVYFVSSSSVTVSCCTRLARWVSSKRRSQSGKKNSHNICIHLWISYKRKYPDIEH